MSQINFIEKQSKMSKNDRSIVFILDVVAATTRAKWGLVSKFIPKLLKVVCSG